MRACRTLPWAEDPRLPVTLQQVSRAGHQRALGLNLLFLRVGLSSLPCWASEDPVLTPSDLSCEVLTVLAVCRGPGHLRESLRFVRNLLCVRSVYFSQQLHLVALITLTPLYR